MFSQVNTFSLILSAVVGIFSGLVFGFGLSRPRSTIGFIVTILLTILSPWIMTSGWFIAASTHDGVMYGIHIGRWLTFFCGTVVVTFLVRLSRRSAAPQAQN